MEYFMINGVDYSNYVNRLKVKKNNVYTSQTNAAGNTVVDYINSKRTIDVGIIPLDEVDMLKLLTAIGNMNVSISFRNPHTNIIEENVNCIISENDVEYYTIQAGKIMYKELDLTFTEL